MLKITRKVEYALIAIGHLQRIKINELASAKEIAEKFGIPKELLAKILQKLIQKLLNSSKMGPKSIQNR